MLKIAKSPTALIGIVLPSTSTERNRNEELLLTKTIVHNTHNTTYIKRESSLNAIPPKTNAKTISNNVIRKDFFQSNSLTRAAIVAMQGI